MADVKAYRKKHYSGLDADKANVTGSLGDSYAANDSGKQYYWNDSLNAWKTGLGYEYVPRAVVATDKTQADFTMDGAWKVDHVDLSGIVPVEAVAIHLKLLVNDNAANQNVQFRANATTKVANLIRITTQVANVSITQEGIIFVDVDRLLDFAAPAGVDSIELYVLGWFI